MSCLIAFDFQLIRNCVEEESDGGNVTLRDDLTTQSVQKRHVDMKMTFEKTSSIQHFVCGLSS